MRFGSVGVGLTEGEDSASAPIRMKTSQQLLLLLRATVRSQ